MQRQRRTETVILDPTNIKIQLREDDDVRNIDDTPNVLSYISKNGVPKGGSNDYMWLDKKTGRVIRNPHVVSMAEEGYETIPDDKLPTLMGKCGVGYAKDFESGEYNRVFLATDEYNPDLDYLQVLEEKEAAVERSITDGLTGLYNRWHFDNRLVEEVTRAFREGNSTSLVIIDADKFKNVNDTLGHKAGDYVLQRLAKIIAEECRISDVKCRYGGEELGIILPNTSSEQALEFAERLRERVEITDFVFKGQSIDDVQPKGRFTLSMGIATLPDNLSIPDTLPPAERTHQFSKDIADELVAMADAALYEAKKTRNAVCVTQDKESEVAARVVNT